MHKEEVKLAMSNAWRNSEPRHADIAHIAALSMPAKCAQNHTRNSICRQALLFLQRSSPLFQSCSSSCRSFFECPAAAPV